MKKAIGPIIFAVVAFGAVVLAKFKPQAHATNTAATTTALGNTGTAQAPAGGSPNYKNGSFTGQAIDNDYGTVQVQAVVSGGKLTDVKFLQLPNDRQHSVEVSNYSAPQLRQEALQAQSANVDIVSGATQTSESFMQSLQSALDQAKA